MSPRRASCRAWSRRSLLSTFTVTNLHDSGPGSLRAAVLAGDAHPGPDIIQFAPGLHGTILLTSGELAITDSLAINGPGALQITVSGNHASRVFDISGRPTVALAGLTIANGSGAGDRSGRARVRHPSCGWRRWRHAATADRTARARRRRKRSRCPALARDHRPCKLALC